MVSKDSKIGVIVGSIVGIIGLIIVTIIIVLYVAEKLSKRVAMKNNKKFAMREIEEKAFKQSNPYTKINKNETIINSFKVPKERSIKIISSNNSLDNKDPSDRQPFNLEISSNLNIPKDSSRSEENMEYQINQEISNKNNRIEGANDKKDNYENKKDPEYYVDVVSKIAIEKVNENTIENNTQDLIQIINEKELNDSNYSSNSNKISNFTQVISSDNKHNKEHNSELCIPVKSNNNKTFIPQGKTKHRLTIIGLK